MVGFLNHRTVNIVMFFTQVKCFIKTIHSMIFLVVFYVVLHSITETNVAHY